MSSRKKPDDQPWDHGLSPDVRQRVAVLRGNFEKSLLKFCSIAQNRLHDRIYGTNHQEYEQAFDEWWKWCPPMRDCFRRLTGKDSPSEVSRAYIDSVIETMALSVRRIGPDEEFFLSMEALGIRRILTELIKISREHNLKPDPIGFAVAQAKQMIRDYAHLIPDSILAACNDPNADAQSLQAPAFWMMKPVGPEPNDPERALKPMDAASIGKVRDSLVNEFVSRMDDYTEDAAGEAYLEPPPAPIAKENAAPGNEEPAEDQGKDAGEEREPTKADIQWLLEDAPAGKLIPIKKTAHIFDVNRKTIFNWGLKGDLEIIAEEDEKGGVTLTSFRRKWRSLLPSERDRLLLRLKW